jgi:hypothetical protein
VGNPGDSVAMLVETSAGPARNGVPRRRLVVHVEGVREGAGKDHQRSSGHGVQLDNGVLRIALQNREEGKIISNQRFHASVVMEIVCINEPFHGFTFSRMTSMR